MSRRRDREGTELRTPFDGIFSVGSRERGRVYFALGRVGALERLDGAWRGVVRGSKTYEVDIEVMRSARGAAALVQKCTCIAWSRVGECKHTYAALLHLLAKGALQVDAKGALVFGADGPAARDASVTSSTSPTSRSASSAQGARELENLRRLVEDARSREKPRPGQPRPLVLGLRLETDARAGREELLLRPVVAPRSSLVPRSDAQGDAPIDATLAREFAWRPFADTDVEHLTKHAHDVWQTLASVVVEQEIWGQERRWGCGLREALFIEDGALASVVALLDDVELLRAPTAKDGAHDASPRLVLERDPLRMRLRVVDDGEDRRLEAVLVRDGAEYVPRRASNGVVELLRTEPFAVDGTTNDRASDRLASLRHALLGGDRLVPVDTGGLDEVWRRFVTRGPIALARTDDEREALIGLVEVAGDRVEGVELPPLVRVEPRPILRIGRPDWWPKNKLPCTFFAAYGAREVRVNPSEPRYLVGDDARYERDIETEARRVSEALAAGVESLPQFLEDTDADAFVAKPRLQEVVRTLLEKGWSVEAEGKLVRSFDRTSSSVRSGVDWFGVSGAVDFDGVSVPLPDVLRAARRGAARTG
ncbi:MAG: hypothetical protein R3F34_19320 [Planctomycetota bacterium]